ncbi:MAG: sulfite exporter TauE/SafE family protein [Anaerolineae bacterium]|nr:sulfite exporter TauE/SafE family protein [Anaerolineae bacterium]
MNETELGSQTSIAVPALPYAVSLGFGLITGVAAGLIGVGGGEFRLPLLLHYFKQRPKTAAAVNLLVGLFTVTLSLLRRWSLHPWTLADVAFMGVLAAASLGGALAGARYAHRLASSLLRRAIVFYLVLVGLWMLFEAFAGVEHVLWTPQGGVRVVAGFLLGLAVAFVSAAFGVAGGEMRIPALLYLFAVPIQEAGTISLAASVPTVAMGTLTYRSLGHLPRPAIVVAVVMATGSLVGVLIGTALLPQVDRHVLKGILGLVLLLATLALWWGHKGRE